MSLPILNRRVPAGGFGRDLTSTERRSIRRAGHSVSNDAIVVQAGADDRGIVYNPGYGGYWNAGIVATMRGP